MNIKILIVDDEPSIRHAYLSILDWEANGYKVLGCARNGKEALDFMKQELPDIVITDLKMPVMSGIELIKNAGEQFPEVKFIVVSGYDDFRLVREAFVLGVKEYFLKFEIGAEVILKALSRISAEIIEERLKGQKKQEKEKELERFGKLEMELNASKDTLREEIISELIFGIQGKFNMKNLVSSDINLLDNRLYVLVFNVSWELKQDESNASSDETLLNNTILNVFKIFLEKRTGSFVFCNRPNEYVVVFSVSHKTETKEEILMFFEKIKSTLWQEYSFFCCGGFSGPATQLEELSRLFKEAEVASNYSFIIGTDEIVEFSDVQEKGERINIMQLVFLLNEVLMSLQRDKIKSTISQLYVSPYSVGVEQIQEIKNLFYFYYGEIRRFADNEMTTEEITEMLSAYEKGKVTQSLPELNKWLFDILHMISDVVSGDSLIIKVKSYIKNNYSEQISLRLVAQKFGISENHLSRIFQKAQKESFTDYLLKTRMSAATQLMKNSNLKIYEVASKVGYSNTEQFSRMFKKVMGISPKSFLKGADEK